MENLFKNHGKISKNENWSLKSHGLRLGIQRREILVPIKRDPAKGLVEKRSPG